MQFAAFVSSSKDYIFIHPLPQSTMCISGTKKINPSKPYKTNAVSNVNIINTFFLIYLQLLAIPFVILNNCSINPLNDLCNKIITCPEVSYRVCVCLSVI